MKIIPFTETEKIDCVSAYNNGLSTYSVGKLFGVSHENVMRWVNKYGKLRTREEADLIQSINLKGIARSPKTQFKAGQAAWNKGVEFYQIRGNKHWLYEKKHFAVTGIKNPNWKGGVTTPNEKARKIPLYKIWRESVMYKDNWTCQDCGIRGGRLTAHHIVPFSENEMLRYSLLNGVTLCEPCHADRHPDLNYASLVKAN